MATACDLKSRHELEIFVASTLSALPFPPMPVMCLGLADGESKTVNSHDLLGTALLNEIHLARTCTRTRVEEKLSSKQALLHKLFQDIYAIHESNASKDECVSQAYVTFGRAFCAYLQFYTDCCDVRFESLESVEKSNFIFTQAQLHFNTHFEVVEKFDNYSELLCAYVQEISALFKQTLTDL